MMERSFSLRKVTFVLCSLLLGIDVSVNSVSQCINRVELLEKLLIPSGLDRYINATSFIPPYSPSEVRTSGIGWCSDDLACNNEESHFIEIDFGAEVIIEAVAILRAGGGYVTHYNIEYAGLDGDYFCIGEGVSNEFVSNENGTCIYLNTEPSNFTNPLIARFVRVIPIKWVGASVCLRMELYGCTIKECHIVRTNFVNTVMVSSSSTTSNDHQVFDLFTPWCASGPVPQVVTLNFDESVYLTQLRVTGNSFNVIILLGTSQILYENTVGLSSFGLFYNTSVIPLWPAINTTRLEFQLHSGLNIANPVCFAVQLTGCPSTEAIEHSIPLLSTATANVDPTNCNTLLSTLYMSTDSAPLLSTATINADPTVFTSTLTSSTAISSESACPSAEATVTTIITSTVHVTVTLSQSTTLRISPSPTVTVTNTVTSIVTNINIVTSTVSIAVTSPVISCTASSTASNTVTDTVSSTASNTVTSTVISTVSTCLSQCTTLMTTPSAAQCSDQQTTTTEDSGNSCNAVAICVPVAVVIALIVCVIVFVIIWRLRHNSIYKVTTSNPEIVKVCNDLYGMENVGLNKADKSVYDYPAFLPEKYNDDQPVGSSDTEKVESSNSTAMSIKNPLYVPTSNSE